MAREARTKKARATIGILGGTGLYDMEGLTDVREVKLTTPFGPPSDAYVLGRLAGRAVAFLCRHGRGHRHLPAEVNYRANIYGFKLLGVERLVSVNSVGSLREEIRPKDIVFADQFFDRTRRPNTFFGGGLVAHISFARPVCPALSRILYDTAVGLGLRAHLGGTYICIDGPAFSSQAESKIYRAWGCDVIGMTGATEAKLCREAEICYATMNLATDYDVWHETEASVSVELILENLRHNIEHAKAIIRQAVAALGPERDAACGCGEALKSTLVTSPALVPAKVRTALRPLIGRYLPPQRGSRRRA
jgi:5'-methylthioadenosine phosphorylase